MPHHAMKTESHYLVWGMRGLVAHKDEGNGHQKDQVGGEGIVSYPPLHFALD